MENKELHLEAIKDRLEVIENEIKALTEERSILTKKYLDHSNNFLDKFKIWFKVAKEESPRQWIPSRDKYPLFRKYLDDNCSCERYATYSIEDLLEDDLYAIFNYDECIENEGKTVIDKEIEEITPILKELMDNNLFSFQYDW